jgi:putative redox protein
MALDKIIMNWKNEFVGTMITPTGSIDVGDAEGAMKPYHMMFGALGACFYSTFVNVANKKRLVFSKATLEIEGTKREEMPKTLDYVKMTLTIYGAEKKDQFLRSVDYGIQYCSVHATISEVANIETEVIFKDEENASTE